MQPFSAKTISDGVLMVSDDLSATLTTALSRAASPKMKSITQNLRDGLFEEAKRTASELTFTEALTAKEKAIRKFTRSAALVGAGAVDKPVTSIMVNGAGYPWEVDVGAVRLMQAMVAQILTRDARRQLVALINRAARFQKKSDPINPDDLAKQINKFLRGEIRRVVDVSANIIGTRVSAYGMFHEARARGISRYRIDAVLDDRTTEICRHLDGREFRVESAYTRTQTLLSLTDPAQQKTMAPFPDLNAIKEKTDAELQAMGIDTPPFHFLCRSVVTLIEGAVEVQYDPIPQFPDKLGEVSFGEARKYFEPYDDTIGAIFGFDAEDVLSRGAYDEAKYKKGHFTGVYNYTGGDYRSINKALRDNQIPSPDDIDNIFHIDKAFERTPEFTEGQFLYRAISTRAASTIQVGKGYQDDGVVSTTINPVFARDWKPVVMQIYFPPGAKGIPIDRFSSNKGEMEVMFQRGSQFRILSDSVMPIGGRETRVIRGVYQGVGEVLPLADIGRAELPPIPDSVVKKTPMANEDKFSWEAGDLKEVSYG